MSLAEFKKSVDELRESLDILERNNISPENKPLKVYSFEENREEYYRKSLSTSIRRVKQKAKELQGFAEDIEGNQLMDILSLVSELDRKEKRKDAADKLFNLLKSVKIQNIERTVFYPARLPEPIKSELLADMGEIEKCYNNKCFRSAIVLCGRVLEIALHRKYYDETGNDILEKMPGTGLGNLVAKMREKGIVLDPALTQQIHLVNQVRIFSVHKKQETFMPTQNQTKAVIIYTCDLLEKLFA